MTNHFGIRPSHRENNMGHLQFCTSCNRPVRASLIIATLLVLGSAGIGPSALALEPSNKVKQEVFASQDLAVEALVATVRSGESNAVLKILGPDAKRIANSGDAVADQAARQRFLAAYDEGHKTALEGDDRATLIIGKDDFPFPIPLVKAGASWRFDAKAGEEEILDRRIGANELSTIDVMRAYVEAQRAYALEDRDGKGIQYAQKLLSSSGKKDGLYWAVSDGEPESPLGPLVAGVRAEGYEARSGAPSPYHGYLFRILKAQGKNAAGGALNYVAGGRMIGGFGLIAVPAKYGNSGVMTFVINHDGVVFERDFGANTTNIAAAIQSFDPDSKWRKVAGQ